jgi:hypothetical protein
MDDHAGLVSKMDTAALVHTRVRRHGLVHHVYEGQCDGVLTKWITVGHPWDGNIVFQHGMYKDRHGAEMFVYEHDEAEYEDW